MSADSPCGPSAWRSPSVVQSRAVAPPPRRTKDLSWRKPVPKFIPSPPPSPPHSSPTYNTLSLSSAGAMMDDEGVPPPFEQLPVDWREAIERALTKDKWRRKHDQGEPDSVYGCGPDAGASVGDVWTRSSSPAPAWNNDSLEYLSSSMTSLDLHHRYVQESSSAHTNIYSQDSQTPMLVSPLKELPPLPGSPSSSRKHLHQMYRPPTPPMPVHYRKRRLPDADAALLRPLSRPFHMVYPDSPMLFGYRDTLPGLSSLPPSTLDLTRSYLPQTNSFAGWELPILPVVLPGPTHLRKKKSSISLTKAAVRRKTMEPSSAWWFDLFCIRWKGADNAKAGAAEAERLDLPGLPTMFTMRRHSIGSTATLIEGRDSGSWSIVQYLWDRVRCW